MKQLSQPVIFILLSVLGLGCAATHAPANGPKTATAKIRGADDERDKITGTATFTPVPEGVKIVVDVYGVTPGVHGIHIHQSPELTDPHLSSAGGHFNPDGPTHHHGGPVDDDSHAGDLGNITVDDSHHGHLELITTKLSIDGPRGVIGRSIILHAHPDDYKTQPAGNSGDRIAGGPIVEKMN